jgi:hypothetical protein
MQRRDRWLGQRSRQDRLPRVEGHEFLFPHFGTEAFAQSVHYFAESSVDAREFSTSPAHLGDMFTTLLGHGHREAFGELFELAWIEEPLSRCAEDSRFDFLPLDAASVPAGPP